ncbi:hypothetical protein KJA64_06875 [Xylella fastidiosa subsp. multiplex]|uniref:hypothetical protein n=2 Tax=Xylella fastidiosa TaxID=2371 RepID=UPI001192BF39|nr:hypothetical protein [Xylella fastidiosa]MBS9445976.1 hypothetical protein [Xylella fastidiosa subsp. multiplex]MBS9447971.1 hypothetical protein [Xylella fastidiosa subsp. multiplex]MBS9449941.1 hypothetical protein [Xylella fastidiosa subsp. multiplex]MBS9451894.1 hypothetical protein [Xylella fastidiosa subsp. multiplex]MBS9486165.1 hypothetical protein [Xylella fastidiosa subsp. multiplex]
MLDALLRGFAYATAFVYVLIAYAARQTRIKTATDGWLDMIAADFFGASLLRKPGQSDASFRARILADLFREQATRNGLVKVLPPLTGRAPRILEPQRPLDTGSYGGPLLGYSLAGGYGSMLLPYQAFVTAFLPAGTGIPYVAGYGTPNGGYGQASQAELASIRMIQDAVTDAEIYAAIDSVKPAGTIVWTHISN